MTRFILPVTAPKKNYLLAADWFAALKEFEEANETEKKPELVLMSQKNFENVLASFMKKDLTRVPTGNIFNNFVMLVGKVKVIGLQFFSDEFIEVY